MAKAVKTETRFEETLWDSATKLRGKVESSEYKHVVLGLVFLKFASDKFEQRKEELIKEGKKQYIDMVEFYTDVSKLAALLDTINNIDTLKDKEQDIVGRVYEYFLSKFAFSCPEFPDN
jgi:type I restriction enzyme M protein